MNYTPTTDAMTEANGLRCACSEKPIELCRELERALRTCRAALDDFVVAFADSHGNWTGTEAAQPACFFAIWQGAIAAKRTAAAVLKEGV